MKSSLLYTLFLAGAVQAHTLFSQFYVNGVPQGDGTCLRLPTTPATATNPLEDLASSDMACGFNGVQGVPRVCSIASADTVTFEFRLWPDKEQPGALDPSHKGPCAVYMKKVADPTTDKATGDGWFKIWEAGYDSSRQKWCSEDLISNNGLLSVKMPSDLLGGYYLLRPEVLALHNANINDPQFYTSCAQVFLASSGTVTPATVSIPGYVKAGEASVSFNIYDQPLKLPYNMPGPAVYQSSSSGANRFAKRASQTIGLAPQNCIAVNGNWCGTEFDSYSNEAGCWKSGEACWAQLQQCYNSAPVTGNKGCVAYEQHCQAINNACTAKNFNGPPNKGQVLTAALTKVQVPAPAAAALAAGSVNKSVSKASGNAAAVAEPAVVSNSGSSSASTSSGAAATSSAASSSTSSVTSAPSQSAATQAASTDSTQGSGAPAASSDDSSSGPRRPGWRGGRGGRRHRRPSPA